LLRAASATPTYAEFHPHPSLEPLAQAHRSYTSKVFVASLLTLASTSIAAT
jgi:hypothetical protein